MHRIIPMHQVSTIRRFLAAALLLTVLPSDAVPQREAPDRGYAQARVLAAADRLSLIEDQTVSEEGGIPALPRLSGELRFTVECAYPEWDLHLELAPLIGEEGPLGEDRVLIAGVGATVPAPYRSGMVVAHGQGPAPTAELNILLQVAPDWSDAPGVYHGSLRLVPVAASVHAAEAAPPALMRALVIPVEFEIPELILVSTPIREYRLHANSGPGRYGIEPAIEFTLASNAPRWEVRLEGQPFRCGEHEIPLGRLLWTCEEPVSRTDEWQALGSDRVLLRGVAQRGVFHRQVRLALDLGLADRAGSYEGHVRLVGING
ncbi:MAG: hypothetical protein JW819_13385 [Candidatus Krumholzibacteriota bacterium]|nr:hypothetical protein [Candidatus Krumholzibacteriota bacterium]